jgi:hypothetical protein
MELSRLPENETSSHDDTTGTQLVVPQAPPNPSVASEVNVDHLAQLMGNTEVDPEAPVHRLTTQLAGSSIQDASGVGDPDFRNGVTDDERLLVLAGWYPDWTLDSDLNPVRVWRSDPVERTSKLANSTPSPFSIAGGELVSLDEYQDHDQDQDHEPQDMSPPRLATFTDDSINAEFQEFLDRLPSPLQFHSPTTAPPISSSSSVRTISPRDQAQQTSDPHYTPTQTLTSPFLAPLPQLSLSPSLPSPFPPSSSSSSLQSLPVQTRYTHWPHASYIDLWDASLPSDPQELEQLSRWMAGAIRERWAKDKEWWPPYSPVAHPWHPFWVPEEEGEGDGLRRIYRLGVGAEPGGAVGAQLVGITGGQGDKDGYGNGSGERQSDGDGDLEMG